LDTVYFDWGGKAVHTLTNDSNDIVVYPTLDALLDTLTGPTRIIGEATFESYNVSRREAVINRCRAEGHELLTTPNRATGRERHDVMGYPKGVKTDSIDVGAIRHLARRNPACLKKPNIVNPTWADRLDGANDEIMKLRRTYTHVESKRAKLGFKAVSAKDTYAQTVAGLLPPYESLPESRKLALGDGKAYSSPLLAAAAIATKHADDRAEFERLAGLYHHGYPSQIRSDFHHWAFRYAKKRGVEMTDFRRECRWLFHQLAPHRDQL